MGWKRNPRVIITFLLSFILCFLLSNKIVAFSNNYETALQIFEPFIWVFGDSASIFLSALLLVLLFCDMPFLTPGVAYLLFRANKSIWLAAQLLFVVIATIAFVLFIYLSTAFLCITVSFAGNQWSDTAAMLGYSSAGSQLYIPSMVKTMEMSTPFECSLTVFCLILLYSIIVAFIMFFANIKKGHAWGILSALAFNLFGLLANPLSINKIFGFDDNSMYIANLIAAWVSPLSHATFNLHSFGYDYLPQLWQTFVFFAALSAIFIALTYRAINKYSFSFAPQFW